MPCPHNEISIVQRSNMQSAVAAAAYQSGEKLYSEYDQKTKHYPEKEGIVHTEILLPEHAPSEYAELVREFCRQQFVSKGMIADVAIHDPDPPGHNPHAHVMLTMRAIDEHGKWLPKSRKVYDLDANGAQIRSLPSMWELLRGRWKSRV